MPCSFGRQAGQRTRPREGLAALGTAEAFRSRNPVFVIQAQVQVSPVGGAVVRPELEEYLHLSVLAAKERLDHVGGPVTAHAAARLRLPPCLEHVTGGTLPGELDLAELPDGGRRRFVSLPYAPRDEQHQGGTAGNNNAHVSRPEPLAGFDDAHTAIPCGQGNVLQGRKEITRSARVRSTRTTGHARTSNGLEARNPVVVAMGC